MKIERIVKWKTQYGIWFLKIVTNEIAYFGIPSKRIGYFFRCRPGKRRGEDKAKGFPCICRQLCGFVIMTKWSPYVSVAVARNFNSFIDVKPRSQCFASRFVSYPIHKFTWSRSHHNNSFILSSSSPLPWPLSSLFHAGRSERFNTSNGSSGSGLCRRRRLDRLLLLLLSPGGIVSSKYEAFPYYNIGVFFFYLLLFSLCSLSGVSFEECACEATQEIHS